MSGNNTLNQIAQGLYENIKMNINFTPFTWATPAPIGTTIANSGAFTQMQTSSLNTNSITTNAVTLQTANIPQITTSSISTFSVVGSIANFPQIRTSSISTFSAAGTTNIQQITEVVDIEQNATGNWRHNFNDGSIFYHSNITSNFTTALVNVPTTPNRGIVTTLVLVQGATPYYSSTLTINGTNTPILWPNGTLPIINANTIECESFTLININGTWTALGQYNTFRTA